MDVNPKEYYFHMSLRFNKCKPEDFDLIKFKNNVYKHKFNDTKWIKKELYDFGWGNECGFMRLPELTYSELWYLLISSDIQENKYGAAYIIEKNYSDKLLKTVQDLLNNKELINESVLKGFEILKLYEVKNRSNIIGKSNKEIERDFKKWEKISKKIEMLLNEYTS